METENHIENQRNKIISKIPKFDGNIKLSYYTQEKFDFITKGKELNLFKEEILSYLRERDSFFIEKINSLQFKTDINNKKIEELSEKFESNYNTFLSNQVELSSKLEKIKSFDAFVNKANDKLISQEIRLNNLKDDLKINFQKYDKIFLENLIVPGYIGKGAKYSNCKMFFSEVIKEIDKFNTYKEKNVLDLSSYKERLENIIKTFQYIVDNYNNSHIKYITKLNEQTNKNILDIVEEKLKNLRMENSHFSLDLLKKSNELNNVYDKIKLIKENLIQEIDAILKENENKIEEANKSFNAYKNAQDEINKKIMNLYNLIKVRKISKNLGFQLGLRQNKDLKNIKYIYEQNNKSNTKIKKIYEIKSNIINQRLSKSQSNFNTFDNNMINLHKNIPTIANNSPKFDIKYQRNSIDSLLSYSRTSSVKNYQKPKNILKYNINIKRQKDFNKSEVPLIDISKSRKYNKTTINLIKNLKKEKSKTTSYEEFTNIKTNNKEDELSLSGSALSNLNNSVNSYTTANDNNNNLMLNNTNINSKIDAMELIEKNKGKKMNQRDSLDGQNDKTIKEIASELEQSTAKQNLLCSNKKEIEKNFKLICDKIQPVNLKLTNQNNLEKIDEFGEKNNYINNYSNKSEQNTTIFSNNNLNNININNFNLSENNLNNLNDTIRRNKLRSLIELKSDDINPNINDKDNISLDQKMSLYNSKLINLESFTKDKYTELIKQINVLKKNYLILTNFIKKEKKNKTSNSNNISEYKTLTNNSAVHKRTNILGNISVTNNENKNVLNLTSNYFNKKTPTIEISSRFSSVSKNNNTNEDFNMSQNLFHNGKYFANIKDIFGQKKFENKKLLKNKNIRIVDNKENKENDININNINSEFNKDSVIEKKETKSIDLRQFHISNNKK